MDSTRALILSTAAGLSTMLGAVLLFFTKKDNLRLVTASIGFAAGVMLSVSFLDLYPSAVSNLSIPFGEKWGIITAILTVGMGLFLAAGIDRFVPHETHEAADNPKEKYHQNLYRVGFVSMLAIGLHNFPEGIATFMAGYADSKLGVSIAIAIALHNIPEGISVAIPVYFATKKKSTALKFTFLSGIAEPIGAFLAFLLLRPFITDALMGSMFGLVTGIMLYIAIEELIPTSRQYGHDRLAVLSTLIGVCIMPLTHIL